jgi:hypothetical protein
MRLRLFNIRDEEQKLPVILEQFPTQLAHPARWGSRRPQAPDSHVCLFEERNGTLYAVSTMESEQLLLNGQPFQSTAVLPGDRLTLGSITFVISYDRSESLEPQSICNQQPDPGAGLSAPQISQRPSVSSELCDPAGHVEETNPCSKEHSACCSPAELVHASIP